MTYSTVIVLCLVLWSGNGLRIFILGGPGEIQAGYHSIADELEEHIDANKDVFVLTCNSPQVQFYINYYCEDIRIVLCNENIFIKNMSDKNVKKDMLDRGVQTKPRTSKLVQEIVRPL